MAATSQTTQQPLSDDPAPRSGTPTANLTSFMGWFQSRTLGTKLLLANGAIAIVTGLIAGGIILQQTRSLLTSKLEEDIASRTMLLSEGLGAPLAFRDRTAAEDVLLSLRNFDDVVAAAVYDKQGNRFASFIGSAGGEVLLAERSNKLDAPARLQRDVTHTVYHREKMLGTLVLRTDLSAVQTAMWRQAGLMASIALLSVLVSLMVVAWAVRRLTRPVNHLASLMRRVSESRNYALRATSLGRDEAGQLSRAFNEMLEQIQSRDSALESELEVRLRVQRRLDFLAHHDSLTGLPNRTLFTTTVTQGLDRSVKTGNQVSILFVDLDHFKVVNDTLGHPVGDALLVAVAKLLSQAVRGNDTVARLGGDEFGITFEHPKGEKAARAVAEKVLLLLALPLTVQGHEIHVKASLGLAWAPQHGVSSSELIKNADVAMYHAKHHGRAQYRVYTVDLNDKALHRLRIENALRTALARNELSLRYQPQMSGHDRSVVSFEALLRWRHPELGAISPDQFIVIAEDTGMIREIGEWVLHAACQQSRRWMDEGLGEFRIAVNVSGKQLEGNGFALQVRSALAESRLPAHLLELEITETVLVSEANANLGLLDDLRKMGVRIAIDDFGIGYSSMSYLGRVPAGALKIDKSFVASIIERREDAAIIGAVVALGKGLDLEVIAEGVETEAQLTVIEQLGCDLVQGYYYSAPLPVDEVPGFVAKHRGQAAQALPVNLRLV